MPSIVITKVASNPSGFIRVGINGVVHIFRTAIPITVSDAELEVIARRYDYILATTQGSPTGQIIIESGYSGDVAVNGAVQRLPVGIAFTPTAAILEALTNSFVKFTIVYGSGLLPPIGYAFVTTNGGLNIVTTNGGLSPVTVRIF